jgi:hypothetical protein
MIDNNKVLKCTSHLKSFFANKKMRVAEVKETVFRLIDYIDGTYDDDSRDKFFSNDHKVYKPISFIDNKKTWRSRKN